MPHELLGEAFLGALCGRPHTISFMTGIAIETNGARATYGLDLEQIFVPRLFSTLLEVSVGLDAVDTRTHLFEKLQTIECPSESRLLGMDRR